MNRIEQVATPAPAQQPQPQPRLPRPRVVADVRRRAAHALLQPREASARTRRGTTGLAVAIAALAVPMLPNPAFGTTSSVDPRAGNGVAKATAPHTRHHLDHLRQLHHGQVVSGPGTVSFEEWAASGWTLTVPSHPADMGLLGHVLPMRHHGYYVPWLAEPARAVHAPGAVVLPGGDRQPGIEAFRESHASPRADDPDAPESQAPGDATSSAPFGDVPADQLRDVPADQFPDGSAAVRAARSRAVPNPLIPNTRPANTKQMLATAPQVAGGPTGSANRPPASAQALAAADPSASPCLRAAYMVGKDRRMLAHLHPAVDAMNVVVTHRRTACGAMVDYLSQARA